MCTGRCDQRSKRFTAATMSCSRRSWTRDSRRDCTVKKRTFLIPQHAVARDPVTSVTFVVVVYYDICTQHLPLL